MLVILLLAATLHLPTDLGHWSGYLQRGSAQLVVDFDFPASSARRGFFSAPDLGAIDIPLKNVKLDRAVHWELVGDAATTVFDGVARGNVIEGHFSENGRTGRFFLRRLSFSTEKPYVERDVSFRNGGVRLGGTLYLPRTAGKHAAILFLQGSGDEGRWASAYLADYLARRGIVALTYDKRGVGASTGDWRTSTMPDLVGDARAGIEVLARLPQVDVHNIGVYGHSQGGELAPAVAEANAHVSWVVAADGPVGPAFLQDIFRVDTALARRYSGRELAAAERLYAEFVDVARTGSSHEGLRSDIKAANNAPWLGDLAIPDDGSWIWSWAEKTGNYDNSPAWAAVRVPVLLLFGAEDELVPPRRSITEITTILNQHGDKNVTVRVFAGADHTLRVPPSSPDGWPKLPAGFPDVIVTFVKGLTQ